MKYILTENHCVYIDRAATYRNAVFYVCVMCEYKQIRLSTGEKESNQNNTVRSFRRLVSTTFQCIRCMLFCSYTTECLFSCAV